MSKKTNNHKPTYRHRITGRPIIKMNSSKKRPQNPFDEEDNKQEGRVILPQNIVNGYSIPIVGVDFDRFNESTTKENELQKIKNHERKIEIEGEINYLKHQLSLCDDQLSPYDKKAIIDFFPEIDLDKLNEVESFHIHMAQYLKEDINYEIDRLENELDDIDS